MQFSPTFVHLNSIKPKLLHFLSLKLSEKGLAIPVPQIVTELCYPSLLKWDFKFISNLGARNNLKHRMKKVWPYRVVYDQQQKTTAEAAN